VLLTRGSEHRGNTQVVEKMMVSEKFWYQLPILQLRIVHRCYIFQFPVRLGPDFSLDGAVHENNSLNGNAFPPTPVNTPKDLFECYGTPVGWQYALPLTFSAKIIEGYARSSRFSIEND
jgi:hypothetical protein